MGPPDPEIKLGSPALQVDSLLSYHSKRSCSQTPPEGFEQQGHYMTSLCFRKIPLATVWTVAHEKGKGRTGENGNREEATEDICECGQRSGLGAQGRSGEKQINWKYIQCIYVYVCVCVCVCVCVHQR